MGKQSKTKTKPTISKKHIHKHGTDIEIPIDKFMIQYEEKQRTEISMSKLTYSEPVDLPKGSHPIQYPTEMFEFN